MNLDSLQTNLLLARLFLASVEFVLLALLVGGVIGLCRFKTPRLVCLLWLLVLTKPVVSLLIGSPIPLVRIQSPMTSGAAPAPDREQAATPADHDSPSAMEGSIEQVGAVDENVTPLEAPALMKPLPTAATPAETTEVAVNSAAHQSPSSGALPKASAEMATPAFSMADVAAGCWLAGFIFVALVKMVRHLRLWRLLHNSTEPDVSLIRQYQKIAKAYSVRKAPRLRVTNELESPALVGVLAPVILLPDWLLQESASTDSPQKSTGNPTVQWALRHELAHWKAGDLLANLLCELTQTLFFFHPLVWWVSRKWRTAMELACDRSVVDSEADARDYAEGLYDVLRRMHQRRRLAVSPSLFATRTQIGRRIEVLLNGGWRAPARPSLAAVAMVLLLAAAALATGGRFANREAAKGDRESSSPTAIVSTKQTENPSPQPSAKESPPTTVVTGVVRDTKGNPVSQTDLAIYVWSDQGMYDTRPEPTLETWAAGKSNRNGRFELSFPRPPSEEYFTKRAHRIAVAARHAMHGLSWRYLKFDGKNVDIEVPLSEAQIRRGRVVDLEGRPVAGATVHVIGVGKPPPMRADFRRFPFHHGLPQDEMVFTRIDANKKGEPWEEAIRFRRPPPSGAWPAPVTTDKEGRFALPGVAREQTVWIHIYGNEHIASQETSLPGGENAPEEQSFVGDSPTLIEGVVKDAVTGKPVAGAPVRIDSVGRALYSARWPIVADWKGRQAHPGPGYVLPSHMPTIPRPAVYGMTDEKGRFRLSGFPHANRRQAFAVMVFSPKDRPYLSVKKTVAWPKKTDFRKQVEISLQPGVRIVGRVVQAQSGRPAPRARIDFWCKTLKYPTHHLNSIMSLSPDGVVHPAWRKAGFDGRFEIITPPGRCYLAVNGGADEYLLDAIELSEIGVDPQAGRSNHMSAFFLPGPRDGKKHQYYPDRVVTLDHQAGEEVSLEVALRRAVRLIIRVTTDDGSPAKNVRSFGGQAPFMEHSHSGRSPLKKTGEGLFEIMLRDLRAPVCAAFLDVEAKLGGVFHYSAEDHSMPDPEKPFVVKLKPCGQAKVRFVDVKGQPLAGYRPLIWLSLPKTPYSGPLDLEKWATPRDLNSAGGDRKFWPLQMSFDAVWLAVANKAQYGRGPITDEMGAVTLPTLIPGATYRITRFNGTVKDFQVAPGKTSDLGEVVVYAPERTNNLPTMK